MLRLLRLDPGSLRAWIWLTGLTMTAAGVGGCSADISRFDAPRLGLTESGGTPTPAAPVYRSPSQPIIDDSPPPAPVQNNGYWNQPSQRSDLQSDGFASNSLPPVDQPAQPSYGAQPSYNAQPSYGTPPTYGAAPRAASAPPLSQPITANPPPTRVQTVPVLPTSSSTAAAGETIEVHQGDTLYGIARAHNVSVSMLMSINHLSGPNLKPGQQLVLPGQGSGQGNAPVKIAAKPAPKLTTAEAPVMPVSAPHDWTGNYAVKAGDNVYGIARAHGTTPAELQRANGITDVRKIRPGLVLKVPGTSTTTASTEPAQRPYSAPTTTADASGNNLAGGGSSAGPTTARPKIINAPQFATAQPSDTMSDAAPVGALPDQARAPAPSAPTAGDVSSNSKLRWPAHGRILSPYGARTTGHTNDGINIGVPQGTDVLAAEAGTVTYSGNELKDYGNLILVRHDNGWVTAYAHNDQLLVHRGDRVKRGQPIAKAGKTGLVDQPQVHFELRQNGKPVDPTSFMEKS